MDPSPLLKVLPIVGAMFLTPVLMRLYRRVFPVAKSPDSKDDVDLRARYGLVYVVAWVLSASSLALPFVLFGREINSVGWPTIGIAWGGLAINPSIWIFLATLPFGLSRFQEFWRFFCSGIA